MFWRGKAQSPIYDREPIAVLGIHRSHRRRNFLSKWGRHPCRSFFSCYKSDNFKCWRYRSLGVTALYNQYATEPGSGLNHRLSQRRLIPNPKSGTVWSGFGGTLSYYRRKASTNPPSTGITCPVVRELRSLANHTIASAQSWGLIAAFSNVRLE